jgi:zinc protease
MKRCAVLALRALVVSSVVTVSAQTPAIQKRQLSNGLLVWIVEHHDLPVVQMSLLVLSGTDDDPPGRYGIASLTSAMLTEGAGSRSSVEIADALDALGANLSTSIGADSSSIQLHVPSARLADALPLMAEAAQRPMFSTRELERLRQKRLLTLRQARDDPDAIASLAFTRVIYGPSHRYGTAPIGTAETIKVFTPEDPGAFHKSTYRPDNGALVVVANRRVEGNTLRPLLLRRSDQRGGSHGQFGAGTVESRIRAPCPLANLMLSCSWATRMRTRPRRP